MRRVLLAHHRIASAFCHVTIMLLPACTSVDKPQQGQEMESGQNRQQIQLDRSVRFAAPDGKDVVVEPGAYKVEQSTGSQIRLVPAGDAQPILLSAEAVSLNDNVPVPTAIPMPLEPDEYDLILLLPSGQTLTAHGWVNQVQARALPKGPVTAPAGAVIPRGPDLVGCMTCQFVWGACYFKASIKNQGDVAAPLSVAEMSRVSPRYDPYRLNNSAPTLTSITKWPHVWIVPGLAPGETKQFNMAIRTTDAAVYYDPSEYTPIVRVDLRNQVNESNEKNNLSTENKSTGVTCP